MLINTTSRDEMVNQLCDEVDELLDDLNVDQLNILLTDRAIEIVQYQDDQDARTRRSVAAAQQFVSILKQNGLTEGSTVRSKTRMT